MCYNSPRFFKGRLRKYLQSLSVHDFKGYVINGLLSFCGVVLKFRNLLIIASTS